jgi:hypothetical protein
MIRWQGLSALVLLLLVSPFVQASDFSFTGTFAYDTDLQFFTFTLANPTAGVALRTVSYGGGTNSAGETIPSGGFEPYLNLYMFDGTQMNPGQSGGCAGGLAPDPTTKVCGDVYYPTTLSFPGGVWLAGTYTVVLSTFANPGVGNLSDGFFASAVLGLNGPSNFTCQVGSPGYQGNPPTIGVDQPFCDEFLPGTERTGNWALDILNVDSATEAPEPGSAGLGVLGGALLLAAGYRRRQHQH